MSEEARSVDQLEQLINAIEWNTVSLEPDITEVSMIEQNIPPEWTETLEPILEQEMEREILEPLYTMDIRELNAILDIPEGDIITNARESLDTLEIDTEGIMQEVAEIDITIDQQITIDHDDFGR